MLRKLDLVLLDTSQLVGLLRSGRLSLLESPSFLEQVGMPFLTMHHLLELGKVADFDQFNRDLDKLESIGTFMTSGFSWPNMPVHILNLFFWELSCLTKQITSVEHLVGEFKNEMKPVKMLLGTVERRALFLASQASGQSDAVVSAMNPFEFNKFAKYRVSELAKARFTQDETRGVLERGLQEMKDYAIAKMKKTKDVGLAVRSLDESYWTTWNRWGGLGDLEATWKSLLGNEYVEECTMAELFRIFEYRQIKMQYSKESGVEFQKVEKIRIQDTHLYSLKISSRNHMHEELFKDTRRKVEASNETDLDFLTFSVFMKTYVDSRILDLSRKYFSGFPFTANLRFAERL